MANDTDNESENAQSDKRLIELWYEMFGVGTWAEFTRNLLRSRHEMKVGDYDRLISAQIWLNKNLPGFSSPVLRLSLSRFSVTLEKLLKVYIVHAEECTEGVYTSRLESDETYTECYNGRSGYKAYGALIRALIKELTKCIDEILGMGTL